MFIDYVKARRRIRQLRAEYRRTLAAHTPVRQTRMRRWEARRVARALGYNPGRLKALIQGAVPFGKPGTPERLTYPDRVIEWARGD